MQTIERLLKKKIQQNLKPNKVCLVFGPRRVGKTVLVKEIAKAFNGKSMFLNGEDVQTQRMLEERSASNYKRVLQNTDLLILDEAQVITDVGKKLKLMVDEIKGIKIIATGSSSFDILNLSGEPLTGRSFTLRLFPLSQQELSAHETMADTAHNMEERLIYGSYPELMNLTSLEEKKNYLLELVSSYLLKDILALDGIRNSSVILDLLRLIAFQTGNEVSLHELGMQLGISKNTVEKYLDLLSKVFVIFRLRAYSRNSRKEISKSSKWYFADNGIRNAVISSFNPLSLRDDTGKLWENYVIAERMKKNAYSGKHFSYYFWRTYDQQEVDFIEETEGKLFAYEIKWSGSRENPPVYFRKKYPKTEFKTINRENYLEFIV